MKNLSLLSKRLNIASAVQRQKGATMIEYVLLAALIGVVVAAFLPDLTTAIDGAFGTIQTTINPPTTTPGSGG
ncbi:Flp family type IVb pilin [Limnohabitans sp. 2KL-3]|uniref:Flp family type IVb pilin n=1 Tax=Limnohabitans sp. 2KL-3 TaxID=1100700 RepID=UPI000B10119E|nr:Flp family type IVb pilin [Limnohabitans sp. 2KL-3]